MEARTSTPWYAASWYRPLSLFFCAAILLGFAVDGILLRDNDYEWHREAGKYFLMSNDATMRGEWYLLGRRMMNASLAFVPNRVSRAIVFSLAVVCLFWSIRRIAEMADQQQKLDPTTAFAATAMALTAFLPHLLRDFEECGLHVILMSILTAGAYALWSGRSILAGFWFALAVTYKTAPVLFLPVLVWKRQWRAAAAMIVFAIALNLLPALYLGWDLTVRCHERTFEFIQSTSKLEDIAENGMEVPKLNNQSLIAAFARYIQSYPPGHPMYFEHAAFFQYGELDKATAKKVAKISMLLIAIPVALCLWGRWSKHSQNLLPQWAAVCIFSALISPVCWRHHLMLAWPALFLFFRGLLNNPNASRWGRILFVIALAILWAPQTWLYPSMSTVLLAAKPDTLVFLSLAMVFVIYPRCIKRAATPALPETQQPIPRPRAA
jgi:hypothetical protein